MCADEGAWRAVDLSSVDIPAAVRELVPRGVAERHGLIPFAQSGSTLQVAISDPFNVDAIDDLRHQLGLDIGVWLAPIEEISRAIARSYGVDSNQFGAEGEPGAIASGTTVEAPAGLGSSAEKDAPVIKLVHDLIREAIRRRASDLHLEPLEKRFRVRCRVDGVLLEIAAPPKRLQRAVISRVKIMANISIAEKRVPQDGRIQVVLDGRSLDLRVSSLPTAHGESVVMRILDRGDLRPGLAELGLLDDDRSRLEQLVAQANGLVLVTGPTGSGKTTTLYGCLQHLNQVDRKLITVEDPVEYQLTGINQVAVRPGTGLTFASALRAMLRQAPNVIMVGEIRDLETAEIALHAALTGHMVFSTLHTNDATGAIGRLADIGVPAFLLSASLRAVLAQRLVRKSCLACRRTDTPTPAAIASLGLTAEELAGATFFRGAGCPACDGTGYHGRIGIFELLVLTDEISQMIHERPGATRLRELARARGMRSLREDGARKVIAGLTTIEEVVSITTGEAR
jgi:general secretion pathway protein E/type IV pilus assembly protein PilB